MKRDKEKEHENLFAGILILFGLPLCAWLFWGWKVAITVLILSQLLLITLKMIFRDD